MASRKLTIEEDLGLLFSEEGAPVCPLDSSSEDEDLLVTADQDYSPQLDRYCYVISILFSIFVTEHAGLGVGVSELWGIK